MGGNANARNAPASQETSKGETTLGYIGQVRSIAA
jgi:hypothetical protein